MSVHNTSNSEKTNTRERVDRGLLAPSDPQPSKGLHHTCWDSWKYGRL